MKEYLIYVNYSLSGCTIYKVTTKDIFHDIGVLMYCAPEMVKFFTFVECTSERLEYWKEQKKTIHEYPERWKKQYELSKMQMS